MIAGDYSSFVFLLGFEGLELSSRKTQHYAQRCVFFLTFYMIVLCLFMCEVVGCST